MDLIIRCSSLGKIMGTPKKPKDGFNLTQTAISYIQKQVEEAISGIKTVVTNKYMDKGIECEQDSIDLYNEVFFKSYQKNEVRMNNAYITGECDIDTGEKIIDIKSSWDWDTFPKLSEQIKAPDYEWQLRGYMWLYDRDVSQLAYCLVDTPQHLLSAFDDYNKHEVSHIDAELRVTTLDFTRDTEKEQKIIDKVTECRRYAAYYRNKLLKKNR